jgi:hypothetical protein
VCPTGASSSSDFGNLEFGVKWRLFASERLELAVSPYQVFGVSATTAAMGIGSEQDSTVVPLVAQYQLSDTWTLNGEVGFASVHGRDDAWGYGAALAYAPGGRTTWLFELYGTADSGFDNESLEIRAGFDAALRDDLHLLFAVASGVDAPTAAGELDAAIFLGIQLFR